MLSIKIKYQEEVRRVQVQTLAVKSFNYDNLVETIRTLFPALRIENEFNIFWNDEEGDRISCSSNIEVSEALHVMTKNSADGICKFSVQLPAAERAIPVSAVSASENLSIHDNVTCDECGRSPIVGVRYKCAIRQNFDLCEACEASKATQPFPMLKIYSSDQCPASLVVTLHPHQHGSRWRDHHHGQQSQSQPSRRDCRRSWGGRDQAREEVKNSRWHRFVDSESVKSNGNAAPSSTTATVVESKPAEVAPFVAAADAMFASNAATEEQLVNEAILCSLQPENLPASVSASSKPSVNSSTSTMDKSVTSSLDQSFFTKAAARSGTNTLAMSSSNSGVAAPKPMARFVKDVTLPDGATVFPGTTVTKTWRIRNDGERAWPEGVTLSFSSGDVLAGSPSDLSCNVTALAVNAETDISMALKIPEITGRHVTYFRLRTADGNIFGQRLWVDLRVVEPEPDWIGVNNSMTAAVSTTPTIAVGVVSNANPSSTANPASVATVTGTAVPSAPSMPSVNSDNNNNNNTASTTAQAPSATEVWAKVWAKELKVLADMGFTNTDALIPLLQEHVGLPVSLCPELNGVPPAEGMQKLVAVLLSKSGVFNL